MRLASGRLTPLAGRRPSTRTRSRTAPTSPAAILAWRTPFWSNWRAEFDWTRMRLTGLRPVVRTAHRRRRAMRLVEAEGWLQWASSTSRNCPVKAGSDLSRALRLANGGALVAPARAGRRAHPVRRQPRRSCEPGARSSLRHWHRAEDEFVMVTEGELVLDRRTRANTSCAPATAPPGRPATATATAFSTAPTARRASSSSARKAPHEVVTYSDDRLLLESIKDGAPVFTYRDGTPWTRPAVAARHPAKET